MHPLLLAIDWALLIEKAVLISIIIGVSLLIAATFISVNLLTDMAYVFLDPRLRRASR